MFGMRVKVFLNETTGRDARENAYVDGDTLTEQFAYTVSELTANRVLEQTLRDLTGSLFVGRLPRPFAAGDVVELVDSGDESRNVQYALGRDGRWQMTKSLAELLSAHYARQEAKDAATMTQKQRVDSFVQANEADGSSVRVIEEPSGDVLCEVLKDGMWVRAAKRFHPDATSEWV